MTQEERQLLLVDLCGRLPYAVKCNVYKRLGVLVGLNDYGAEIDYGDGEDTTCEIKFCKPYLRPMSSMTEDELQRYHELCDVDEAVGVGSSIEIIAVHDTPKSLDYLNSIHVDYRGLIPKGLALSTDGFNPYK